MLNIGVVLAGGVGQRYASSVPKQYHKLAGREVISYAINALKNSQTIDAIIVVCDKNYQDRIIDEYNVEVCNGGDTRNKTVKNAIDYILKRYVDCSNVIFIDSARPLCRAVDIDICIKALNDYDIVITGQKITDSLGSYSERNLNRENYYLVQTPEAFRFKILKDNFDVKSNCTALYQQIPVNKSLYVYFGIRNNIKITYPGDIGYIENNFSEILEK